MVHWYMVHGTLYHTTPYHIMYQTTPCTAPCTRPHHIIPHRPPCMTLANHNATPYYATLLRGFSSNYNSAVVVLYYVAQSTSDDRVTHLHSKNGHTTILHTWVLQQSLYSTVLAASYQSQDNIWGIREIKGITSATALSAITTTQHPIRHPQISGISGLLVLASSPLCTRFTLRNHHIFE